MTNPYADEPANCAEFITLSPTETTVRPSPPEDNTEEPDLWAILGFTAAVFLVMFLPYALACFQCPNFFVNINKVTTLNISYTVVLLLLVGITCIVYFVPMDESVEDNLLAAFLISIPTGIAIALICVWICHCARYVRTHAVCVINLSVYQIKMQSLQNLTASN